MNNQFREDLNWALKAQLINSCRENKTLTESAQVDQIKFISEQATYEQMLNLCFVKDPNKDYFSQELLESIATLAIYDFAKNGNLEETTETKPIEGSAAMFESVYQTLHEAKGKGLQQAITGRKIAAEKTAGKSKATEAFINDLYQQAKSAKEKVLKFLTGKTPASYYTALAVLGAAAIGAVAYYFYKNHLSQAAKACKGKTGDAFKQCVAKFKKQAAAKTVALLKSNKAKCAKQKNPEKCIAKIDKQIAKFQAMAKK